MQIHDLNVEQANAWNGYEGAHWAEHQEHYDAAIRGHSRRLLDAAGVSPDDHVLDVGCGCGASTREVARLAGSGTALGVDLSSAMIERARMLSAAEGLTNVRFEQGDAQVYPFAAGAFDLAISRFGAMFFGDPLAAFTNIARTLRPGGRLVLLAWQELRNNEWLLAIRGALAAGRVLPEPPTGTPGPFGLAEPDAVGRILTGAGFESIEFQEVNEPIVLGGDADDAFAFASTIGPAKGMLEDLDETARAGALEELRKTLAAHAGDDGVQFDSSAWLISAGRASPS